MPLSAPDPGEREFMYPDAITYWRTDETAGDVVYDSIGVYDGVLKGVPARKLMISLPLTVRQKLFELPKGSYHSRAAMSSRFLRSSAKSPKLTI